MQFDFTQTSAETRYKLLCSFIGPRPIALVTSRSVDGNDNAAPMSFFNVFAQTPPLLIIGLQHKPDGTLKDTTRNILDTKEFVVNLVDEALADSMITCSIAFPPEADEIEAAGLTLMPSVTVKPGWVAQAPAALECRLERAIEYPNRLVIFGEVSYMHIGDQFINPETLYVRADAYRPLARLHADFYIAAKDQFELPRMSYEEWLEGGGNPGDKE